MLTYLNMGDIIMGFDNVAAHIASGTYTGNIIGQYANRLCGGKFSVNGTEYQVTQNEKGKNTLNKPINFIFGIGHAF